MKKLFISILSCLAILSLSALAISCGKKESVVKDNRTVILSATELTVEKGKGERLSADLSVGKGKFVWSSSDETVATVDENGTVFGVNAGKTTVTATCGGKKADCVITVVLPDGYPKFVRGNENIETFVGKTYKIDTAVKFNGEEVEAKISYDVENEGIATVNGGVVTGVKEGVTALTVTANYCGYAVVKTITVKVHGRMIVEPTEENVTLQLVADSSLGYNVSAYLGVKAYFDLSDVTEFVQNVVWTTENDEIVTVAATEDQDGRKSAIASSVGAGATKIKCDFKYNGESYSYSFNVTAEKSVYVADEGILFDSVTDGKETATLETGLPANCAATDNLSVIVGGNAQTVQKKDGGKIVLSRPTVEKGETEIVLQDDKWICSVKDGVYATAILTADNHSVLKSGGEIPAGSYYVLGEDVDVEWSSKTMEPIKVYGTLDGRGRTLKGITLDKPATGWWKDLGDSSQTYVSYIATNGGVIKNLAVRYETTTSVENGQNTFSDLIHSNNGEINNVFVTAHVKGSAWYGSLVVGKNYGVIKNCVTVAPTYPSEHNLRNRLSAYVAFSYGGSIIDCYTLGEKWNGLNDSSAYGAGKCYSEAYTGGVTLKNWRGVTDMAEILAVYDFSSDDGWNKYWTANEYSLFFSGEEISLIPTTYLNIDYVEEKDGAITIPVPEDVTLSGMTVTFNDKKVTPVSVNEGVLTVKKGSLNYGEYTIKISYADKTYKALNVSFVTKAIRNADAGEFIGLFTGDEDSYYVLAEDVYFGGKGLAGKITLKGTLDGKGHSLKNFTLDFVAGGEANGWNAYLFAENKGTIKNISFDYSMKDSPNDRIAIVDVNSGVIENVYSKVKIIETIQNDYQKGGAITRQNSGGTIRNCIVDVSAADGVIVGKDAEGSKYSAVAAVAWYNQNGGKIERCYANVSGCDIPITCYNIDGTVTDSVAFDSAFDMISALKLDSALGWSGYFKIVNGELVFG